MNRQIQILALMRPSLLALATVFVTVFQTTASAQYEEPFSYVCMTDGDGGIVTSYRPDTLNLARNLADVQVEIDYMVLRDSVGNIIHHHWPEPLVVQAVTQMFACAGRTIEIQVSDEIPEVAVIQTDPTNPTKFFGYGGASSFLSFWSTYADFAVPPYHYCIFGHRYQGTDLLPSGNSGLGQKPGLFFVVTLGGWTEEGTELPFFRASSLAHELGHNLGLSHCGIDDCKDHIKNHPVNLTSIMSYNYQLRGIRSQLICQGLATEFQAQWFRELDYARGHMCFLSEAQLYEPRGIGMRGVDWNCDGTIQTSPVSQDTDVGYDASTRDSNTWCGAAGGYQDIVVPNEWAYVKNFNKSDAAAHLYDAPTISCISYDEWRSLLKFGYCPVPDLVVEDCRGEHYMRWAVPDTAGHGVGHCSSPNKGFVEAYTAAYENSVIYLIEGTYVEGGTTLTLSKPMTITTAGRVTATLTTPAGLKKLEAKKASMDSARPK